MVLGAICSEKEGRFFGAGNVGDMMSTAPLRGPEKAERLASLVALANVNLDQRHSGAGWQYGAERHFDPRKDDVAGPGMRYF